MSHQIRHAARGMAPVGLSAHVSLEQPPAPALFRVTAVPELDGSESIARYPLSLSLLQEWDALAVHLRAAPYLYPGWAQAWWHAFGNGRLDVRTLRRGGRLVAVLPMVWNHGVLESAANYHTPGFGILAEDNEAALTLAREVFAESPTHLSITSLDPAEETISAWRRSADETGYRVVMRSYQRSLYIDLVGSWSHYESGLGRNLLRNLRRAHRHLEHEGKSTVEVVHGDRCSDGLLQEAFTVEASGWKGAGQTAIESDARTRAFYTDVARWGAAHGMLRLYFLRQGPRPIAMYFALAHQGTCHLLKGGYDPAYRRHSPGNLLMHAVIQDCFAAGFTRIEFNGDAEPYKFCWASAVRERKRLEAFAPSFPGRMAWSNFTFVRPVARRVQRAFGIRLDAGV